MIRLSELRCGNLLYLNGKHGGIIAPTDIVFRVMEIHVFWITALREDLHPAKHDWDRFEPRDVSPVPLTTEWLERLGFEKRNATEDGEFWGVLNFTLIYARHDEGGHGWFLNGYHNDRHLLYVHQLQNLYFALTGEELTVKETA